MLAWHFTEMPYPHLPPFDELSTIRVTLPSKYFDPKIGADLYNRYLDEYVIADELGPKSPKIVDASTAHRVAPGWTFGFPEMDKAQAKAVAKA